MQSEVPRVRDRAKSQMVPAGCWLGLNLSDFVFSCHTNLEEMRFSLHFAGAGTVDFPPRHVQYIQAQCWQLRNDCAESH